MRRLAAAAAALSLCSCSSLLSFDIDSSGTSTIPKGSGGGILGGLPGFSNFGKFDFSNSSEFKNQNTNKSHISECHVTRLTLKVTNPAGNDLSFISKLDFFIEAPNLEKKHIAGSASFPKGQSTVDLTLDNLDIAAYAKSDSFSITTTGQGTSPQVDTTIQADIRLNIHASVL